VDGNKGGVAKAPDRAGGGTEMRKACEEGGRVGVTSCALGIDPFRNLLAPALFGCFREKTRFISNVRASSAGATGNFGRGLWGRGALPTCVSTRHIVNSFRSYLPLALCRSLGTHHLLFALLPVVRA
jgi:hypothetical protein